MARKRKKKSRSIDLRLAGKVKEADGRDKKLWICQNHGTLNEVTARHLVDNNPELDLSSVQVAHQRGCQERRHKQGLERFEAELLDLTPMKRLDAIVKNEKVWGQYKSALSEHQISWQMVQDRKTLLHERKAQNLKKRESRLVAEKEESFRKALTLAEKSPLDSLNTKVCVNPNAARPFALCINMASLTQGLPKAILPTVEYAIIKVFRGCVRGDYTPSGAPHVTLNASAPVFLRLVEDVDKMNRTLQAIHKLQPGTIDTINTAEAVSLCGLSRATFDAGVKSGLVPVACTETFNKWGRTLVANKFEIRDIIELVDSGAFEAFEIARETRKSVARKKGAQRAIQTRTHRARLRAEMIQEARTRTRDVVRATGTLAAGHHLELFEWAQRASRFAKTKPSQKEVAYQLKHDALLALYEAGALDVTFIDAGYKRLTEKCGYHEEDWYHIEDLLECSHCRFHADHYHSLYAFKLKFRPHTGGLHMPYTAGHRYGLPNLIDLEAADHDLSSAHGRRLDDDEVALFPVDKIAKEIERLISIVAPSLS